jgi:flagellar hook-associated protein 1 FlgK
VQLVGTEAATLQFSPQGAMTPTTQWSADSDQRSVGTITLTTSTGGTLDLITNKSIRSGQIAAYLEMRDQILVQAQGQVDQIAGALSSALSDQHIDGSAVTYGAQQGYDIDVGGLSDGNAVTIAYTDLTTNKVKHITLVQVSDPSQLPLSNNLTADPNDKVIGADLSHGLAAALASINSQFNNKIQFSNPVGTTLRILDDGAGNNTAINSVTANVTQTSLTGGTAQMPLFTDVNTAYTNAITDEGQQSVGYAGRIRVNADLLADPSKLVTYQTGVAAGDPLRPGFLYDQLATAAQTFSPNAGIGSPTAPFTSSIPTYIQQMLSVQGAAADAASQLKQGQDVVVNSLTERMNQDTGVNVDEEMTHLLQLQNSYAANARVLSTVKAMLDTLMNM